jgi:glycine dehydrogenase subunit 2
MSGNEERTIGTTGLFLEEPLLFERSVPGRRGFELPPLDVPERPIEELLGPENLRADVPGFPELSEVDVVRHFTRLSQWNYSIDLGMYPLGSCTMKYNPKVSEQVAAALEHRNLHPFDPEEACQGALQIMYEMQCYLAEISGLPGVTLQPAAGAHGELTGILIARAYHLSRGEPERDVVLIPDSAHGTNPASSAIGGFRTVQIPSGKDGLLDLEALGEALSPRVAALMVTNPNTLGLFESRIAEAAALVHEAGGLVYADGANMNAVLGHVRPSEMGIDILHFNLHKTFATPHGGGGPGSGPVAVRESLARFLPVPVVVQRDGAYHLDFDRPDSIGKVATFWGSFGVLLRAYVYIRSMGPDGLKRVADLAVLNANYIRARLVERYHLPYDGLCKHEVVFNDQRQNEHGVKTLDIAKRLMDYGFHPPTIYFPLIVHGALMIEPAETESLESLDRFVEAMLAIAEEAERDPELVRGAPRRTKRFRLDETMAARKPVLRWRPAE